LNSFKFSGHAGIAIETASFPFLGYLWRLNLSQRVKAYAEIAGSLSYHASSFSRGAEFEIKSPGGYGLNVDIDFTRKLQITSEYELFLLWNNELSYRYSKKYIISGVSSTYLKSRFIRITTGIGVKVGF
jgi:hypothetical protein